MPKANIGYRWVPAVNNLPHLEYGLYERKSDAVKAARDIAAIRYQANVPATALKVHYKVMR